MKEIPKLDLGATFVLAAEGSPKEFVILLSQDGRNCRVQDVHGHILPAHVDELKYPAIKS